MTGQPATYRRDGDASFFYDMVNRSVDPDAADRIGRNQAEMRGWSGAPARPPTSPV